MQVEIEKYIGRLLNVPTGVRNLADLITFNTEHADEELPEPFYTDQSEYVHGNPIYAGPL